MADWWRGEKKKILSIFAWADRRGDGGILNGRAVLAESSRGADRDRRRRHRSGAGGRRRRRRRHVTHRRPTGAPLTRRPPRLATGLRVAASGRQGDRGGVSRPRGRHGHRHGDLQELPAHLAEAGRQIQAGHQSAGRHPEARWKNGRGVSRAARRPARIRAAPALGFFGRLQ